MKGGGGSSAGISTPPPTVTAAFHPHRFATILRYLVRVLSECFEVCRAGDGEPQRVIQHGREPEKLLRWKRLFLSVGRLQVC